MSLPSRLLTPIALVVLVCAAGCATGRLVVPITFDASTPARPAHVQDFSSDEATVRGIAGILTTSLGLPLPEHVTVYVYSSRAVFERGLINDARISPARAAQLSEFAVGVGKRRQVLLHRETNDPRSREWLRLIAHELAHVSQIELAQGEGRAEQWLTEGMAEWVAFTVLDRLSVDTLARRRALAFAAARAHPAVKERRLDLATLGSPFGFTTVHLRDGSESTYQLSFMITDYLIARAGFARVMTYFSAFTMGRTRERAFLDAFGQSRDDFEREVLDHLSAAGH
jgi:uncharacterized protein DUF4157